MKRLPFKPVFTAIAGVCLLSYCLAANPPAPTPTPASHKPTKEQSHFVFSLLPKSFQKNPLLAMTVITDNDQYQSPPARRDTDRRLRAMLQSRGRRMARAPIAPVLRAWAGLSSEGVLLLGQR